MGLSFQNNIIKFELLIEGGEGRWSKKNAFYKLFFKKKKTKNNGVCKECGWVRGSASWSGKKNILYFILLKHIVLKYSSLIFNFD